MSAPREPSFFGQAEAAGGSGASGTYIPSPSFSRTNVEARSAVESGGNGNGAQFAESEKPGSRMANLVSRFIGAGPARVSKPEQPDADAARPTPRIGTAGAEEKLPASQTTDDLLDIPAFLRRQAH